MSQNVELLISDFYLINLSFKGGGGGVPGQSRKVNQAEERRKKKRSIIEVTTVHMQRLREVHELHWDQFLSKSSKRSQQKGL